jgi:RNA polymerase sigma-70 factor (ECF subfamily)
MPSGQAQPMQMNVGVLSARELAAERRLIEASQRDRNRFGQLYERYFDRVYAFAITRTGDRAAAEDVTAETFRRALQNLSHFKWRGVPFSAWLFRIAANAASDLLRHEARHTPLDNLPEDEWEPWETRLIEVEQRTRLIELVNRLPKDQRRVIYMRFVDRRRNREIAEAIGRSEGAVKALQFRALENLRAWVEEA